MPHVPLSPFSLHMGATSFLPWWHGRTEPSSAGTLSLPPFPFWRSTSSSLHFENLSSFSAASLPFSVGEGAVCQGRCMQLPPLPLPIGFTARLSPGSTAFFLRCCSVASPYNAPLSLIIFLRSLLSGRYRRLGQARGSFLSRPTV